MNLLHEQHELQIWTLRETVNTHFQTMQQQCENDYDFHVREPSEFKLN